MSDFKTNYFGTFLDTMASTSSSPSTSSATGSAAPRQAASGAADAVLQTLAARNGSADVKDLLPHTGFSVDALIEVVARLASFGFVTEEGSMVMLTAVGRQVAAKKA